MDRDAVDAIGGGRVWTGRQALKNGLVDELGGLDLGIQKVQEMIGLAGRPRIQIYEMKKGYIPPTGKAISAIGYGFNNLKQIYGKVTCICPWVDF
jgi:protease-4